MKLLTIGSLVSFASSLFNHCSGLPSSPKRSKDLEPRSLKERSFEGEPYPDMMYTGPQLGDIIPFRSRSFSKRDQHDSHPLIVARAVARTGPNKELSPPQQQADEEYHLSRSIDITKPEVKVYNLAGRVAFTIKNNAILKSFDIVNNQQKILLSAFQDPTGNCTSRFSYASADKAVTVTYVAIGEWSLKFGTNSYSFTAKKDSGLRELKDAQGRVDTTVENTVADDKNFKFQLIRAIKRNATSQCPLEYVIGLLVAIGERDFECR